jgi:hypothetical protein
MGLGSGSDVGLGIGMRGNHDGKRHRGGGEAMGERHQGGGEVTGGLGATAAYDTWEEGWRWGDVALGRRGGDRGIRSHYCIRGHYMLEN